ncbi:HK97 family phage prohead protease [Sutcliffiella horikoshii]|uniref:HK97 family phage prohead protease n=1 Tax=Sutcliffiella horikoshii TaxID=79883 RepID=A0A5D4T2J1_9BACI|nr:HK97 family phage prohead protease [Sutcliffiella horikoshii]TYS68662.1 HK97 family phage prohead protease [Sutcliffiella horikoshii]
MMNREKEVQIRSLPSELTTRFESDEKVIEGYFAVFNSETELWPGAFEEIDPGAFNESVTNDVRALINHDTNLVLGRTKSGTLELRVDGKGLWGKVKVNEDDSDAVNAYARLKRGDVDQCSFGFRILEEETEFRDDGSIKWRLKKVDLHEISVVTFPAYADTSVQARKADYERDIKRMREAKKNQLRERLKHGTKTTNAGEEN